MDLNHWKFQLCLGNPRCNPPLVLFTTIHLLGNPLNLKCCIFKDFMTAFKRTPSQDATLKSHNISSGGLPPFGNDFHPFIPIQTTIVFKNVI